MKARTKFMIGGLLVIGTAGYLAASAIKDTGVYFAVLAVQSLIMIVSLARSGPRSTGLAAPAVTMFGGLQVIEVLVFGAVAAFLLAIGAAILQPLSYLRSHKT